MSQNLRFIIILVVACSLIGFHRSEAAVINSSVTVDLDQFQRLTSTSSSGTPYYYYRALTNFTLDTPFWAKAGDTVILTVKFKDDKFFKIDGSNSGEYFYVSVGSSTGQNQSTGNGSSIATFLGTSGSLLVNPVNVAAYPNNYGWGATNINSSKNLQLTDSWFAFNGMTITYNINSLTTNASYPNNGTEHMAYFTRAWLQFQGTSFEVLPSAPTNGGSGGNDTPGSGSGSGTPVPAMGGWWLVPGMLAGVGILVRRRKE